MRLNDRNKVLIQDKEIQYVELYRELPMYARLDCLPFLCLYFTCSYLVWYIHGSFDFDLWISLGIFPVAFLHVFIFLCTQWSVDVRFGLLFHKVSTFELATAVKVFPIASAASMGKQHCALHQDENVWFEYQKIVFCAVKKKDQLTFGRLDYPTAENVAFYCQSRGYVKKQDLLDAKKKWGQNEFDIPIPPFMQLFREHAVAPFFVFQVFCVLLWCLDEYIYYSLMTLVMLVVFESTVVKQRQRNMANLRRMRRPPQSCLVYREGAWCNISTLALLPGDIFSVRRSTALSEGHDNNEQLVPCDVLLLQGSCVVNEAMLSGESIPLRKQALQVSSYLPHDHLEIEEGSSMIHKKHIVYGGTKILQHTMLAAHEHKKSKIPPSPDGGCPGYVLRTGFGTTQGSLMRTILYSSERVTANSKETLVFILVLLTFALAAATVVLSDGLADPTRNRFKLLLHCIMIITSVVPPELPMELSLAVNNSLMKLTRLGIYCTEPFRIPFAGKVDVCCFDKTGTLTSDELEFKGIATDALISPQDLDETRQMVLAGCHSLIVFEGKLTGDPMEKAVLSCIGWRVKCDDSIYPPPLDQRRNSTLLSMKIIHRFSFDSTVKRMSSVVQMVYKGTDMKHHLRLLSKGAPEVMKPLFHELPSYYDQVQHYYTSTGCRVLVMGYRDLAHMDQADVVKRSRGELEQQLVFCGFIVLECPLKDESKKTIRDLRSSSHQVKMITGDNALTACDVARKVGMTRSKDMDILILQNKVTLATDDEDCPGVEWLVINPGHKTSNGVSAKPFSFDTLEILNQTHELCVTGTALLRLVNSSTRTTLSAKSNQSMDDYQIEKYCEILKRLVLYISVFARTSPSQKQYIIHALNQCQQTTVMCGDGTNDVGALKQAHVGVSIVNNPELEDHLHQKAKTGDDDKVPTEQPRQSKKSAAMKNPTDLPQVKLGDASIASAFTSKSPSIRVIKDIIRQGRCTLVMTIQMYKILGVNCLITAYMLSFLFLHGVKQGDQQLTINGVIVSMFFLFISFAKPAKKLSKERPPSGIGHRSVLVSIAGQFMIHMTSLRSAVVLGWPYLDPEDPTLHPDSVFSPSVMNTIVYLISFTMQINTFVVNYKGQPYMLGLMENQWLWRFSLVIYTVLIVAIFEWFPPINEAFELTTLPDVELQLSLFAIMCFDTIAVFTFERVVKAFL